MLAQPGVRFGLVNIAVVITLVGCRLTGADLRESTLVVASIAGLVASGLGLVMVATSGLVAWAFVTGFVENRYATLTLHHGDLLRMVVAIGTTSLVAELGAATMHTARRPVRSAARNPGSQA